MIAYHGTTSVNAQNILREGFRVGSWFAYEQRNAVPGGAMLTVDIPDDWVPRGEPDENCWQFYIRDPLPPSAIISCETPMEEPMGLDEEASA